MGRLQHFQWDQTNRVLLYLRGQSLIAPCLNFVFVTPDTPDTPEYMAKQRYKTTLPCSEITNCDAA